MAAATEVLNSKDDEETKDNIDYYDKDTQIILTIIENEKWELNKEHFKFEIKELSDEMDVAHIDSNKLLDIFDKIEITKEEFDLWAGYGDSGAIFHDKNNARSRLKTVVEYVENSGNASNHAKK